MTTTTTRPASDKQVAFIDRLVAEKVLDEAGLAWIDNAKQAGLTTRQASIVIDRLMALPRKPKTAASTNGITEDGMYIDADGNIFKAQFAHNGSGNLYCKALVEQQDGTWSFAYAPGAVRKLTPAMKMSLEQATAFGSLYGVCCVCGRVLTDEESIQAGIGPVCATKF